jgi:hypothetical protein
MDTNKKSGFIKPTNQSPSKIFSNALSLENNNSNSINSKNEIRNKLDGMILNLKSINRNCDKVDNHLDDF